MAALDEMQSYTYVAKYAQYDKNKKRRLLWAEAVDKVKHTMLEKYKDYPEVHPDIEWAYGMMKAKKVLGSQRALQFAGKPVLDKHARIYNCSFSYCDRTRFFQECLYLLLCGTGVGYSVQKHHVDKIPPFSKRNPNAPEKTFVIPDTIEGWSDAIGCLISNFIEPTESQFIEYSSDNCSKVVFDYSLIRPAGSPLSSGIGKAPGPKGLENSIEKIRSKLELAQSSRPKLSTLDAHDIICYTADCVLSGGIRRSALISLFSHDDEDMMNCKTGDWFANNPQRARSNNSAVLLRKTTKFDEFNRIIQATKEFGEPGFMFVDTLEAGANPCLEIGMYAYDDKGRSGFQMCNLSTINSGNIKSKEDLLERIKAAAIIGTLQAGFTDFPYLGETTEYIVRREALLGVSMTGMMDSPELTLDVNIQKEGAELAKQVNKEIAAKININQAARVTALKPEGSTSCLLGTSSGIHPHHSARYLRRIQANKQENPVNFFKQFNPQAVEESVWSAGRTDYVVSFPIEVGAGSKLKNQMSALEMLEIVKQTQENWIQNGKNIQLCVDKTISHNVSNTVVVKPNEWDDVAQFIYDNRQSFTGVSLIPESGDKDYAQAPFTSVYTANQILQRYGNIGIWSSGLIEAGLQAFGNLWFACDAALGFGFNIEQAMADRTKIHCQLKSGYNIDGKALDKYETLNLWDAQRVLDMKIEFCNRIHKFADKYADGNIKHVTYCLKDVYNWKLYTDLQNSFQSVDYSQMTEEEDNTKLEQEIACAGGACQI